MAEDSARPDNGDPRRPDDTTSSGARDRSEPGRGDGAASAGGRDESERRAAHEAGRRGDDRRGPRPRHGEVRGQGGGRGRDDAAGDAGAFTPRATKASWDRRSGSAGRAADGESRATGGYKDRPARESTPDRPDVAANQRTVRPAAERTPDVGTRGFGRRAGDGGYRGRERSPDGGRRNRSGRPDDRPWDRRAGGLPDPDAGSEFRGPNRVDKDVYDGPPLPDEVTGKELDRNVRAQLHALPEKLGARVARHLVAAAQILDDDPDLAYRHALAARARASRVPVVREAVGEAAYASGRFREALQELKAARRIGGEQVYLPMMADCERALGRPQRAIAMAKDAAVGRLDEAGQAEMMIVAAGARRDLGDIEAALRSLDGPRLHSQSRAPWVARIRYAYADLLLAAGRRTEAREWFERAESADLDGATDAAARLAALADVETDEPG